MANREECEDRILMAGREECEAQASVVGEDRGVHSGQFGGQEGMDAEDERLQVCALQLLV